MGTGEIAGRSHPLSSSNMMKRDRFCAGAPGHQEAIRRPSEGHQGAIRRPSGGHQEAIKRVMSGTRRRSRDRFCVAPHSGKQACGRATWRARVVRPPALGFRWGLGFGLGARPGIFERASRRPACADASRVRVELKWTSGRQKRGEGIG